MTDREASIAVYKAVEALYVRLFGEPLQVSVETSDGLILISGPSVISSGPVRRSVETAGSAARD